MVISSSKSENTYTPSRDNEFVVDKEEENIIIIDYYNEDWQMHIDAHSSFEETYKVLVKKTGQTVDEARNQILNSDMYYIYYASDMMDSSSKPELRKVKVDLSRLK